MATMRAVAHGVQQIERQLRRARVELDAQSFRAVMLLELARLRIGLRRAHHHDAPRRRLGEKMRAEVVAAHVRGQENRAVAAPASPENDPSR